jgi:hypothetical protein
MTDKFNKVALILDPNFGQRLTALASRSHVWIVDTPANRLIAEEYWQDNPEHKLETGITTFEVYDDETVAETCLRILDTIDLHHGGHSSDSPYSTLEIISLPATQDIKCALEELGFEVIEQTAYRIVSGRKRDRSVGE